MEEEMEELCAEGLATRGGPESCVGDPRGRGEALAGARVKAQLKRRMHDPVPEQGRWLASVVRGHMAYYAVPGNAHAAAAFRQQVTRHWLKTLRRRSQKTRTTWQRMRRIETRWLPRVRVMHPYPNVRFDARTQGRSPVR
jgi:RNA-directed DNA polymerase